MNVATLDPEAEQFVRGQLLASGGALSVAILQSVSFSGGTFLTLPPAGLDRSRPVVERLGPGVGEQGFSAAAHDWMFGRVLRVLRHAAAPRRLVLFEDPVRLVSEAPDDVSTRVAAIDDTTLVAWLAGSPGLNVAALADTFLSVRDWIAVGALVGGDQEFIKKLESGSVPADEVKEALTSCDGVVVSAFDGEGFVMWVPSSHGP